ncbi:MAG TPA: hypothetical protein VIK17_00985 [Cellulomonas sp.]
MSILLRPVGPNPPRVYWIRRFVVMVALVAVIAGVVAIFFAFRGDAVGAAPAVGAAATTKSVVQGAAQAPATPVGCRPADLQLAVVTDAAQYPPGAHPVLQTSVTNIGSVPCTVDAGDVPREVVVSSGADRVWSTKDCASADTASRQLLLAAGARDSVDIPWGRLRSAGGCPGGLPAPRAGTYQAVATLLGVTSQPVAFVLQ